MDVVTAHIHRSRHRARVEASDLVGCSSCLASYPPAEIDVWLSEIIEIGAELDTALRARCGIDAVLPGIDVPVSRDFLASMQRHWL